MSQANGARDMELVFFRSGLRGRAARAPARPFPHEAPVLVSGDSRLVMK
jgi:hypothetical protein